MLHRKPWTERQLQAIVYPPKMEKERRKEGERKKKNRGREQVDFPQWQRRYRAFEKAINISANQRIHKARTLQKRSIHTGGL